MWLFPRFWTHFAFSMLPPERAREGRLGASSRTISSTCIDFRKCYKNQLILNDFAPADHPDRSRRPFLRNRKSRCRLGNTHMFGLEWSFLSSFIKVAVGGGPGRCDPPDRPGSTPNRSYLACQSDIWMRSMSCRCTIFCKPQTVFCHRRSLATILQRLNDRQNRPASGPPDINCPINP